MIIWLASYPKSGNTWIRAMLSSLVFTKDGNFNFEILKKIDQFPDKLSFDSFVNVRKFKEIEEIAKHWISVQEKINSDNKIRFLKTHNAMCQFKNYPFSNTQNTLATIYVVRDPRNVVSSISRHFSIAINKATNLMLSSEGRIYDKDKAIPITILGSWADHYNSWKNFNKKNLLIIKYEDLIENPKLKLLEIINFLNKYRKNEFPEQKIKNILDTTTFKKLQEEENKLGFTESVKTKSTEKKIRFFYLGKKNDWKVLLDKNIEKQIVKKFDKEMKELGYIN